MVRMSAPAAQEGTFFCLGSLEITMNVNEHTAAGCRGREILERIGDKWSLQVIAVLGERTLRFTELKREIEGISQRMLTVTLRGLERDGIVARTVYPVVPPRVDYELTLAGRSLQPVIAALAAWGQENVICEGGLSCVRPFDDAEGASGALGRALDAVG